jgi:hypothetical protein
VLKYGESGFHVSYWIRLDDYAPIIELRLSLLEERLGAEKQGFE